MAGDETLTASHVVQTADRVAVDFREGTYEVPSCYYEFARRYEDENGNLFNGFIAGSADKIFESTDFRK